MSDYEAMLAEFDLTEADMRRLGTLPYHVVGFAERYSVNVRSSPIEGNGLFSTDAIVTGETIAPAFVGRDITPAGRYANHAGDPNARLVLRPNGDMDQVALRDIESGEEITNDYRHNARALYACAADRPIEAVNAEMVRDAMHAALDRIRSVRFSAVRGAVQGALAGGACV